MDRFFFFNPFSLDLLKKVMADSGILLCTDAEHTVVFYYPSDEYIAYLMTVDELIFAEVNRLQRPVPGG